MPAEEDKTGGNDEITVQILARLESIDGHLTELTDAAREFVPALRKLLEKPAVRVAAGLWRNH